jgi:hypothetical protein
MGCIDHDELRPYHSLNERNTTNRDSDDCAQNASGQPSNRAAVSLGGSVPPKGRDAGNRVPTCRTIFQVS